MFWDETTCSPLGVRFGGIYCYHLQIRYVRQRRNKYEAQQSSDYHLLLAGIMLRLIFDPENEGHPKRVSTRLCGVTSQRCENIKFIKLLSSPHKTNPLPDDSGPKEDMSLHAE